MAVKHTVKKFVRNRLGWNVEPMLWHPRHLGGRFNPTTIIDVGVNQGTPELYAAFPDQYLLLIDAMQESEALTRSTLAARPGEFVVTALGAEPGEATMNIAASHGRSSLLQRSALTSRGAQVETRTVPIQTLDNIAREKNVTGSVGLKIDVEGYEMQVLEGARSTLSQCEFVILEMSVAKRFEGAPTAHETMKWMADAGFELVDILSISRTRGRIFFIDALFVPSQDLADS